MIRSMTGFGQAERTTADWCCRVEMRSVNARFLEVRCRLPSGLLHCEDRIKSQIKKACTRGRFECNVSLNPDGESTTPLSLNAPLARAYGKMMEEFRELTGQAVVVTLHDLVELKDLVATKLHGTDPDGAAATLLQETVSDALDGLVAMRENEGRLVAEELAQRIGGVADLLSQITPLLDGLPEQMGRRLRENLARYGQQAAQDGRILQEIAILLERSDVSEEIMRFRAHLQSLREILVSGGPLGRKFEFVLQELNREANTLSTKCNHPQVGALVVEVKAELERLREQIQNIE